MTALTRFFFRVPWAAPTTWSVLQWWESRRFVYNVAVGTAGVLSLATLALAAALPPYPAHLVVPWQAVVVYAILANGCYTLGPLLDAAICRRYGPGYAAVGPTMFRYGFAFAVGLTLLPIPLALLSWGVRVLRVFF